MSIADLIRALETAGTLVRYMPRVRRTPRRRLFLAPEARADLTNPGSATNLLVGKGAIVAALDRWTLGERVHGHKRGEFLDRLKLPPPEIWEIRVTSPAIQARLFGRFAEPDTLILTKFHTRTLLGKRGSEGWTNAMFGCRDCWDTLFPGTDPFSGPNIHAYVTENCDAFAI